MTKRDLAIRVSRQSKINQGTVMEVIQHSLDIIVDELAACRNIEFRNFGVFEVTKRRPRIGRNPKTPKKTVKIPERAVVKFKPGKVMRERVLKINPKKIG